MTSPSCSFLRCEFCDFSTHTEEGFQLHARTCIARWKHALLSPQDISYADALMTCFTWIEKQNEKIQSLQTELTKAKPFVRVAKKKGHLDMLSKLRPIQTYDEWIQALRVDVVSLRIPDLLRDGIKYITQTIFRELISHHTIPSMDHMPAEDMAVTLPLGIFAEDPTTIYVWNGEWGRMDNNTVYSSIVFVYSRISEHYLKHCIELGDMSITLQVMEELNKHQPKNSISEQKQFLCGCLLAQIQ